MAQAAWKSWTIAGLLAVVGLLSIANIRLASRPPEVVLVDAGGCATAVKQSVATDALLKFLAERTPPRRWRSSVVTSEANPVGSAWTAPPSTAT